MSKIHLYHKKSNVSIEDRKNFYKSKEWQRIRYFALKEYGNQCMCCGAKPPGVTIDCDHIKSLSTHWHLRADLRNIQVLCRMCNLGKSNVDDTDWRGVKRIKSKKLKSQKADNKKTENIAIKDEKTPSLDHILKIVEKIGSETGLFIVSKGGMMINENIVNIHTPWKILRILGVSTPPKKGWMRSVLNRRVSPSKAFQIFNYLKNTEKTTTSLYPVYRAEALWETTRDTRLYWEKQKEINTHKQN